jgi:class 3 adenylate cyclase
MDDPQIRYARTSDGVNIAYWTMGTGPPVVMMSLPNSNVQFELQPTELEPPPRIATLIRYDHRGFGLSDKHEAEFTTEEFVRDLEAVVDKLGLGKFFLLAAGGWSYPIALTYAKLHPERVLRIAAQVGSWPAGFIEGILDAAGTDWHFLSEAIIRRTLGWTDEAAGGVSAHLRASTDEPGYRRFVRWASAFSAMRGLRDVQVPCLFLAWRSGETDSVADARQMAGQMSNGSVHVMMGGSVREFDRETNSVVTSFFTQGLPARPPRPAKPSTPASGTAVILFTDIVDSTALTERLGDARFREASRSLDERLRAAIREGGGAPIEGKVLGDGVMASFSSAREAIAVALRCSELSAESELGLHIGLHAGDVIREQDPGGQSNVYGGTVNIASRICGLAAPGEVLVSDVVRGMARSSADVSFIDRGDHEMKGVGEPVRLYAVVAGDRG